MKDLTIKLTGIAPLILHNNQTVDPQNYYAIEAAKVRNKKPKTDADLARLAEIDFMSALYLQDDKVILPTKVLGAAFIAGAKKDRQGPGAKAGAFFTDHAMLEYGEDLAPEELFTCGRYTSREIVKVQQSSVVRVRPIFHKWGATVKMIFDPEVIDESTIQRAWERAGHVCGVGDWRPQHGRFAVEFG